MAKTVINARVIDQALILENLPVLASGGVDEIQVVFSFCDLWANATKKTAVFFRDPVAVYHAELTDDACAAPWEPFAAPGTVYVGVFAEYADGTTRTCEALPLTVAQGAITKQSAAANAPNIYAALEQRVKALEERGPGATAEQLAQIQANADAIANIQDPVVSGNTHVNGNTYTLTMPRQSGTVDTLVLEFDANGYISKVTENGREIPWTTTGV